MTTPFSRMHVWIFHSFAICQEIVDDLAKGSSTARPWYECKVMQESNTVDHTEQ